MCSLIPDYYCIVIEKFEKFSSNLYQVNQKVDYNFIGYYDPLENRNSNRTGRDFLVQKSIKNKKREI